MNMTITVLILVFNIILLSVATRGAAGDGKVIGLLTSAERSDTFELASDPSEGLVAYRASADLIADSIAAPGVTILSATLQGEPFQAGLFSGGLGSVGLSSGAILSTGRITDVKGPDDGEFSPSNFESPGFAPLTSLTKNGTFDASVLTIMFQCPYEGNFSFKYVFGSEDYSTYNTNYAWEDVMGAFLNGLSPTDNIATVNGRYVSVKTINCDSGNALCPYFINNTGYDTEMNGFTTVLEAKGTALAGSNILTIAIADGLDGNYPSWLLIGQGSLTCPPPPPPPAPQITKMGLCIKVVAGCPCANESKMRACVKSRATSFCTLPITDEAKQKYCDTLSKRYQRTQCKKK